MNRSKLRWLPLMAGSLFLTLNASSCTPDASNSTVTAKSKKFYCTESLDSSGCNAGRNSVKFEIESSCKQNVYVDLECTSDYWLKTRKYTDGKKSSATVRERVLLENGEAEGKVYMSLSNLTDPMMKIKITNTSCQIVSADTPVVTTPAVAPVAAPIKAVTPKPTAPAQPAAPSILPQPEVKELVITPAPKKPEPAAKPEAKSGKEMDLEILKEQNRAKELEIEALKLQIKLKEMER
ncbi:MAG: hypothetical protein R3302_02710 [Sulfurimonadaceae bacterium]|nr:hypothetical protein [Sulfurimonadaceae bacterium]